MLEKERVIKAINHIKTDVIPFQLDLTQDVFDKLSEYYGDDEFLYTIVGNHLIREKNRNHKPINSNSYKDIFGVTWFKEQQGGDIGIIKDYIFKEPDISLFTFPEPDTALIKNKCGKMITSYDNLFKIYEIGFSLYERAWTLRGIDNLLMDFIINEQFVDNLLDKIVEYNLQVIDIAAKYPIDCIMFGDDWGQQKGLIMGPRLWREFIKPRVSLMYERVKKHGLFVAQHSCGDNNEIIEDLIDIGLDIYNTFQPEIYNVKEFKKEYGNSLTIYGGISTQGILSKGTPEQVKAETKRMMELMGENGGYIAAPTHQLTTDIPLVNILAFIDAVKTQ